MQRILYPRALKPDFESITSFQDTLYLFGSDHLQTKKHYDWVWILKKQKKNQTQIILLTLYTIMQSFAKCKPEDFNLEGGQFMTVKLVFINRGNGEKQNKILYYNQC
jgi:hypothetical protein